MANGMKQALFELTSPVEGQVDSYTEKVHFAVSHLKRYDRRLRKERLAFYKTFIFSETNEIHSEQKNKQIVIFARENSRSAFVSVHSMIIDFQKSYPLFAALSKPHAGRLQSVEGASSDP